MSKKTKEARISHTLQGDPSDSSWASNFKKIKIFESDLTVFRFYHSPPPLNWLNQVHNQEFSLSSSPSVAPLPTSAFRAATKFHWYDEHLEAIVNSLWDASIVLCKIIVKIPDCKKLDFKNEIKGAFSDRSKTRSKEHLMFNNPSARRVNLRLNILQYNYVVKSQEATRRTGRKQL